MRIHTAFNQFVFASAITCATGFCTMALAEDPTTTTTAPAPAPAPAPAAPAATPAAAPATDTTAAPVAPAFKRWSGYASIGLANLTATPKTGGKITLSQSDTTAPGESTVSYLGGSGLKSSNKAPQWTLGARFNQKWGASWGLEAQYSTFNDSVLAVPKAAPGTTPTGTNFATTTENSVFKTRATDIAATARFERWGAALDALVGKRYGRFDANGAISTFGVFTTGNFSNINLSNGSKFEGDGLVYGFGLNYKIPTTWLSVFVSKKWAQLDGESDSFGRVAGTVASSPSAPLVGAATVSRNNEKRTKLNARDFEAGAQFDFKPSAWNMQSFVRLSYQNKKVKLNGPPTGGAGFGGTIGELTTNSFASAGLGSAEIEGFLLSLGTTF